MADEQLEPQYLKRPYRNFSGGQVSSINSKALTDNELVKAYDVRVDKRGVLQNRLVWSWLSQSATVSSPAYGIYTFWDRDGREWLFLARPFGTGIVLKGTLANQITFEPSGSVNWLIYPTYLNSEASFKQHFPRTFTNYQGDMVMSHSCYTGLILLRIHHGWVESGSFIGGTTNNGYQVMFWPLHAHVVTTFMNSIIVANTAKGQNFIHWSAPEEAFPDHFVGVTFRSYYYTADIFYNDTHEGAGWLNVYPNEGDGIMAAKEWNNMLGIFRRHSLLMMNPNHEVRLIHEGYGTISQNTVVVVPGGWAFIDYEGKGVYLWDGSSKVPTKISEAIDDEWQEILIKPPVELGCKVWDTEEAFSETGDSGAGISNLTWSDTNQTWSITAGQVSGTWTSNVMTTEESFIQWLNIRPEITMTKTTAPAYTSVKIEARSGTDKTTCLAASWYEMASGILSTVDSNVEALWFAAYPSIVESCTQNTIASATNHTHVQIRFTLTRNAAGTTSCELGTVRLNYIHGGEPTTYYGRFANLHWDGELLWVNVVGEVDGVYANYVNRTYIWNPKFNSWVRWKKAIPACMTQFDRRTVWATSTGSSETGCLNHGIHFTSQNRYEPDIIPDPAINPRVIIPYTDFGDPCRLKTMHSIRLSWKDQGTGTLALVIHTQRPPESYAWDTDDIPTITSASPPTKSYALFITLTDSGEDRVWNIPVQELMLIGDVSRKIFIVSDLGTQRREFSEGYAFQVELRNDWTGIYSDNTHYPGHNIEFILNAIELRVTLEGDDKWQDVPHEVL